MGSRAGELTQASAAFSVLPSGSFPKLWGESRRRARRCRASCLLCKHLGGFLEFDTPRAQVSRDSPVAISVAQRDASQGSPWICANVHGDAMDPIHIDGHWLQAEP